MTSTLDFLCTIPWFAWIPIIAIVCGCVTKIVDMSHRHSERIEMIRHGLDPDTKCSTPEL